MTSRSDKIWSPSETLSPRLKGLREEFFSFYQREYFRNEVRPYTTGTKWDAVFSPHNWGVVPETFIFFAGYADSLLAGAEKVELPEGFFHRSLALRRAIFFDLVIEKYLPVKILNGELIVGSYFNTALSRCLTKEEAKQWQKLENEWEKDVKFLDEVGIGNAGAVPGHIIPSYKKILELGFKGIHANAQSELSQENDLAKRDYLEALSLSCLAPQKLALRYQTSALELAKETKEEHRRTELLQVAENCGLVPWEKPQTFYQAVQALWFTHMLVMAAESYPGAGLSYGRIDQYLYPFYSRDLANGSLTKEWAKEILACFCIKHNYSYDYQGRLGTNQGINSGFGQLITLGGHGPKGEDLSNDLTWLFLETIEELNLLEPKPNVRIHANSPDELLERLAGMIAEAQGAPFLLNFDENAIAGLQWQGLPEEELWDYAPVGCLENTLQGSDRSGTVDVNLNLAKAVELTLNNGCEMIKGKRVTSATGEALHFKKFNEFYLAFKAQLQELIGLLISNANKADYIRSTYEPTPYLSLLVEGCLEKRQDITAGGALHNYITVEGIAFATAADSVIAVKKLVYDEQRVSMSELVEALRHNFDGQEKLRQILINKAPKYGNDDNYADELARDLSVFWTTEVSKHQSPATGRRYRAGYLSWNYWIGYAPKTAATPDGRHQGSFLSNGIGPVNGADRLGPTAVIKSVGNIAMKTAPSGASHTLSLSPSLLRDQEHIKKFANLLKAYNKYGGTALQVNVIDAAMLKDAQQKPDDYRNLLVRVTGYNAYFLMLGKEIQDEIIARESHGM